MADPSSLLTQVIQLSDYHREVGTSLHP